MRIAIFASGTGSNTKELISYFKKTNCGEIALIVSGNKDAGVLNIAAEENIKSMVISKDDFIHSEILSNELRKSKIELIVLAGFLWLIPNYLTSIFERRIINIHPALLPNFGGKGMYGSNVHKAVKASGITSTGITIHLVDEKYDEGEILFQASCEVLESDTIEDIANKVHQLEHRHYPIIVAKFIQSNKKNNA